MRHIRKRINEDGDTVIAEIFPVGFVPTEDNLHVSLLNDCMSARDDVEEDWVLKGSQWLPADEDPAADGEVSAPEEESEESEEESE
tara:strand:- start:3204 stop:3461 length:258 start_codon:yes stop_codon:yes gene_type:complete